MPRMQDKMTLRLYIAGKSRQDRCVVVESVRISPQSSTSPHPGGDKPALCSPRVSFPEDGARLTMKARLRAGSWKRLQERQNVYLDRF